MSKFAIVNTCTRAPGPGGCAAAGGSSAPQHSGRPRHNIMTRGATAERRQASAARPPRSPAMVGLVNSSIITILKVVMIATGSGYKC